MLKLKNREVDVEEFALEYIKHDALVKHPYRGNKYKRVVAYHALAQRFGVGAWQARSLEKRFRSYVCDKMESLVRDGLRDVDELPEELSWLALVEDSFNLMPKLLQQECAGGERAGGWAGRVLRALCTQALLRGALCDGAMFDSVRRCLRLAATDYDLEAAWDTAKRLSLEYLSVCARAGDVPDAALPEWHARVADVVLLYTDLDAYRLITDESEQLYAEAEALSVLWQLVQRHRLEERAPPRSHVRAQRWSRALREYCAQNRAASLVVLQRRWHELKLRTRYKLVNYWRTTTKCHGALKTSTPACSDPPREIHISILKRYPHIVTSPLPSWRELVDKGLIITRPLDDCVMNVEVDSSNSFTTRKRTAEQKCNSASDKECRPPKTKLIKSEPNHELRVKDTYSSNVPCVVKLERDVTDTTEFSSVLRNIKTEVEDDTGNDSYLEIYNVEKTVKKETWLDPNELPTNGSDRDAYEIEIDMCIKQEPVETVSKCPILFSEDDDDDSDDIGERGSDDDVEDTFDNKLLLDPYVELTRIESAPSLHDKNGYKEEEAQVKVKVEVKLEVEETETENEQHAQAEDTKIKVEVDSHTEADTHATDEEGGATVRLGFRAKRKHQRVSKAQQSLAVTHTLQHNNKLYILQKVEPAPPTINEIDTPTVTEEPATLTLHQLNLLLHELTDVAMVNHLLRRTQRPCCAARRHHDISEARVRMGLPPLARHTHADGAACSCCCGSRARRPALDAELRALAHDLAAMGPAPAAKVPAPATPASRQLEHRP